MPRGDARCRRLPVRLTETEYAVVRERMRTHGYEEVATYLRACALAGPTCLAPNRRWPPARSARGVPRRYCATVRLSESERATLRERMATAGYRELGAYLRAAILAQRPPRAVVPAEWRAAWAALGHLAGNLNQIAHHLNAGHILAGERVERLAAWLVELTEEVRRLRLALLGVAEGEDA